MRAHLWLAHFVSSSSSLPVLSLACSVSETMLQIEGIRVDPTSGCVEVAPSFTDGTMLKKTDDFGKEYEEEGPEHAPRVVFKLH